MERHKKLSIKELHNILNGVEEIPSGSDCDLSDDSDTDPTFSLDHMQSQSCYMSATSSDESDCEIENDHMPEDNFQVRDVRNQHSISTQPSEMAVASPLPIATSLQSQEEPNQEHNPTQLSVSTAPPPTAITNLQNESDSINLLALTSQPTWDNEDREITACPDFIEKQGPSDAINNMEDKSPLAIFKRFFDDEIIQHIVFQTNLYATQEGKPYKPTDSNEIQIFLGINLFMGMKRLPSYRDYWSSKPDFHDYYISSIMTVNRFGWLLSHLHFNDNSLMPNRNEEGYDKLYKIRPIINYIEKVCTKNYHPYQKLVVDEAMVKFKGRSSLKQYLKDKPTKRGFKIWMLCDSKGYNSRFEVYTGKKDGIRQIGLASRVVLDLCRDFCGKNHQLFVDNFFNSYELLLTLKENKIFACGTLNPRRKNLPILKSEKSMVRGDYDWKQTNDGITMIRWMDKKTVNFLSNYHDPREVMSVKRRQKDGSSVMVPCPKILSDYNLNMNFVDNFDRLKKDYQIDRKSKKWYLRLFFHYLDVCITNSFIIHKQVAPPNNKLTNKNFRRAVYDGLISKHALMPAKTPKRSVEIKGHKPHVSKNIRLESNCHQPVRSTSKRCAKCSTKKNPVRTIWMCTTCNVPLCLRKDKDCFQHFHK